MLTEKHVELAAKMYAARKQAIALLGMEKFKAKVNEFRPILEGLAENRSGDILKASMDILKGMQNRGVDGIVQMVTLAACVEIIEPSTGE